MCHRFTRARPLPHPRSTLSRWRFGDRPVVRANVPSRSEGTPSGPQSRSHSSAGERPPHTRKVAGSIPAGTTAIPSTEMPGRGDFSLLCEVSAGRLATPRSGYAQKRDRHRFRGGSRSEQRLCPGSRRAAPAVGTGDRQEMRVMRAIAPARAPPCFLGRVRGRDTSESSCAPRGSPGLPPLTPAVPRRGGSAVVQPDWRRRRSVSGAWSSLTCRRPNRPRPAACAGPGGRPGRVR